MHFFISLTQLAAGLLCLWPAIVLAHGEPLFLSIVNGKLTTDKSVYDDPSGDAQLSDFGPFVLTNLPGLNVSGMQVGDPLHLQLLPRTLTANPSVERYLWHWNATGGVSLAPNGEALTIATSSAPLRSMTAEQSGALSPDSFKVADITGSMLGFHTHPLNYFVQSDDMMGSTVASGLYATYARFTSPLYQASDPFWLMFNNGLAEQQVIDGSAAIVAATMPNPTPSQWKGFGGSIWTANFSWVNGVVPNSATAEAIFGNAAGAGSPAILNNDQTVNKLTFNSTTSYLIFGATSNSLNLSGANPRISTTAENIGEQIITTSLNLGNNTAITVDGGSLAFSLPSGATSTVGTGVTAAVGAGDTLQLGGAVSALGSTGGNKARVTLTTPTSTLSVTGDNQVTGRITGAVSGSAPFGAPTGNVSVASTKSLTADGIRVNKLTLAAGTFNGGDPDDPANYSYTTAKVAAEGGSNGLIVIDNRAADAPGLVMGNNSILNINDNDMVLYYNASAGDPNPTATVQSYIDNYFGFLSNVPSIQSDAYVASGGSTTFVAFDNQNAFFGDASVPDTFPIGSGDLTLGDSSIPDGFQQTIIRYTYAGDFDLNGVVNGLDAALVITNLGNNTGTTGIAGWTQGDGDGDGFVGPNDFALVQTYLGKGTGGVNGNPLSFNGGGTISAIPEPSVFVVGALGLVGLAALRLRRRAM